nr:hypothetical protein HGMM_F07C12C25 [uncultured Gammaproteobacteria bacterium]BAL55749.1 hypothetical protein HGMM_F31D07C23 [uncultured Gammaproteobacteria bacterium]
MNCLRALLAIVLLGACQSAYLAPNPERQSLKNGAKELPAETGWLGPVLKGLEEDLQTFSRQLQDLTEELDRLPRSPQFRELERRLEELAKTLREAETKFQQDVLPKLREEMERLQKELEKPPPERKRPKDVVEL